MSLKKYEELTEDQKQKVRIMYSDQETVKQYLYNFDGDKYLGRQYTPPSGIDEKIGPYGIRIAEPLVQEPEEIKEDQSEEDQPAVEEKQKTRKRTSKKK